MTPTPQQMEAMLQQSLRDGKIAAESYYELQRAFRSMGGQCLLKPRAQAAITRCRNKQKTMRDTHAKAVQG